MEKLLTLKEVLKEFEKLNINGDFEREDIGGKRYALYSEKLQMEILIDEYNEGKFLYYFDDTGGYSDNLSFKELIKRVKGAK